MGINIKTWFDGMAPDVAKDLAYWERNMLALKYADGWYEDLVHVAVEDLCDADKATIKSLGIELITVRPRYKNWVRVLSLDGGKITFHIPDDFDVGNLPKIKPNWDGHTTREKWTRIAIDRGIDVWG